MGNDGCDFSNEMGDMADMADESLIDLSTLAVTHRLHHGEEVQATETLAKLWGRELMNALNLKEHCDEQAFEGADGFDGGAAADCERGADALLV